MGSVGGLGEISTRICLYWLMVETLRVGWRREHRSPAVQMV